MGYLTRLRRKALLPSVLLANVQLLENKLDELRSKLSFQRDRTVICFSESWLNKDMENIFLYIGRTERQRYVNSGCDMSLC